MKASMVFMVVMMGCTGTPRSVPVATVQAPHVQVGQGNDPLGAAAAMRVVGAASEFGATFPRFMNGPLADPQCGPKTKVARWVMPPHNIWPPGVAEQALVSMPMPLTEPLRVVGSGESVDGLVRTRARVDGALGLTLWMRMSGSSAKRTGVAAEFVGDQIEVFEMRDGVRRVLVSPQPIYRFERRKVIEIVATLLGKHVVVQVYDADSGVELLSIYAETHVMQAGHVLLESGANPPSNRLILMSQRQLCGLLEADRGDTMPVPRYFSASLAQVNALPSTVRKMLTERERSKDNESSIWEADLLAMELAYCNGVELRDIKVEPPFKFQDVDYANYRTRPPVRAAVGFRIDLSYQSPAMVERLLRGYAAEFPDYVRLEKLGTSHQGRPIWALGIGRKIRTGDPRPSILLNGGHHGDEPLSVSIVLDAIQQLLAKRDDPEISRWLDELVIWTVPMVNPDGAEFFLEQTRFGGRKNGRDNDGDGHRSKREGVDLNRNYPIQWGSLGELTALTNPFGKWFRGPNPGSEPETQAIMKLAERERFAASISYHTGTVCILAPYTVENLRNPAPNEAWKVAKYISKSMGRQIDGRRFKVRKNIYPVEGVDQDWLRYQHGTLALLIEAVGRTPNDVCERADAMLPSRLAWQALLRRTVSGPVIVGRVKGVGRSVEFRQSGYRVYNGERLSTRPRDGAFLRYVESGRHGITVRLKGQDFTAEVDVGDSPAVLTLELP